MERLLFLVCTISALVLTVQISRGIKLSLRQGPEELETSTKDVFAINRFKNCTMCPRLFKPVCASNGNWYHNPCFMACEVGDNSSINIIYEGMCRPEHYSPPSSSTSSPSTTTPSASSPSTPSETPVNFTIKGTYGACQLCDDAYYKPICATNGKTYRNQCFLECSEKYDVKIAYEGKCERSTPGFSSSDHFVANCSCSKVYDPVCATNGEWYYNTCVMNCVLENDTDIQIRYHGKCIHFWRKTDDGPS